MNILLVGSGAREHALAHALNNSPQEKNIFCLASNMNPGILELCTEIKIDDINDPKLVSSYALKIGAAIAIVGPENPLAMGVADALWAMGTKVVGPKKNLAQIETSKSFARDLLTEYDIAGCPEYRTFSSMGGVLPFLQDLGEHYVVKYDGLAGGKGVKVAGDHLHSHNEATAYCQSLVDRGGKFIIEEKLNGQEFSLMSFCDGNSLKHMPAVQDHKRAYEGDIGPNTGGMGTYSDANHSLPFLNEEDINMAHSINVSTAKALKDKFGEGYKGVLYGGFISTANGVKLIEYNARLGDPEAMNVLPLLDSCFIDICNGIVDGNLSHVDVQFKAKATVCKYAVPQGYPDNPIRGIPIEISDVQNPEQLFYASVDIKDGQLILGGSRAVAAVGIADNISSAEEIAEKNISAIEGPVFHRTDIGTNKLIQNKLDHMLSLQ